ncbi:MAG TPA: hypothetical protein VGO43_08800 [Pyrinomonadaceae bacterium]|jgi:hypothetical protein|nr:hypothetical protein [Pyrinomonadaceae bacterium]
MTATEYRNAIAELGDGALVTIRYKSMMRTRTIVGRYRPSPVGQSHMFWIRSLADNSLSTVSFRRILGITPEMRRAA